MPLGSRTRLPKLAQQKNGNCSLVFDVDTLVDVTISGMTLPEATPNSHAIGGIGGREVDDLALMVGASEVGFDYGYRRQYADFCSLSRRRCPFGQTEKASRFDCRELRKSETDSAKVLPATYAVVP